MTKYPPGKPQPFAPERRESRQWPLLVLVVIVALGGLTWAFKPDLLGQAFNKPQPPSKVADAREKPDTKFADLYQRYSMAPIDAGVAASPAVDSVLVPMQKEPCDQRLAYKASLALEKAHATRAAAELLRGVGSLCADAQSELHRASELFLLLGDYDAAARSSGDVIRRQPDAQNAYYVRARAEQGRQNYAAAIDDYVTLIRVLPDLKAVRPEVFTRLSETYEKLDRPCEAITPLQTYMALDPERRTILPLERRIVELAVKGSCGSRYAQGTARIARRSAGVPIARAEINGVAGTFLIDTGASFVTLSPSFAARAKPTFIKTGQVELQTANGIANATLATVDLIKLSGLSAAGVPTVVASKAFGDGVDGLLGMSFLGRFTILIEDGQMKLTARVLKPEE